jgi:hypothetical protein
MPLGAVQNPVAVVNRLLIGPTTGVTELDAEDAVESPTTLVATTVNV